MDNVTHSLAGLLLAELAARARARRAEREPAPAHRAVAALSAMVAANLPDADLLYTGVGGDRLAYMLHHRGYTHTVPVALLGALLLAGAAWGLLRARRACAPGDGRWLLGLMIAGTLSHLLLDWTNSYGVHPFWPLDDRWYYGDAVFIVEPWLWVASVPALFLATTHRISRVLLALVLLGGLALAWRVDLVTPGARLALTLGAVVSALVAWRLVPGTRAAFALLLWVAVTLAMAAGAHRARAAVLAAVHAADPSAVVLDVVVTPLPANAVCATIIAVERSGATYRVTSGRASALPRLTDAARCGSRGVGEGTPSRRPSSRAMHWDEEWTAPVSDVVTLARESCAARAALRFIRVPVARAAGDSVSLGDARFGGASGGFSTLTVPRRSRTCPANVPPWVPPRADLGL